MLAQALLPLLVLHEVVTGRCHSLARILEFMCTASAHKHVQIAKMGNMDVFKHILHKITEFYIKLFAKLD